MGDFLNEFAVNLLPALTVFAMMGLPIFSHFYNQLMDKLANRSEHTSIYVAIGVAVTVVVGGLFSWKSALLYAILFGLSGMPMIIGEFRRTEVKVAEKSLRRRRLPYAANGCIEDAHDAVKEAQRLIGVALKNNGKNVEAALSLAGASTEISLALSKLIELKSIQYVDK